MKIRPLARIFGQQLRDEVPRLKVSNFGHLLLFKVIREGVEVLHAFRVDIILVILKKQLDARAKLVHYHPQCPGVVRKGCGHHFIRKT